MKKRKLLIIYIAAFLALCLIPSVGMLFAGETRAAANEVLAPAPKLTERGGGFNAEVLNDTSDYIADHFALRQRLVTLWAELNARVFGTSVEEQVMLGKGNWLFYSATANDCLGIGLSDGAIRSAARNVALMREYAESAGCRFVFTVAPNKGSLYPEYLPKGIVPSREGSNAVRLSAQLAQLGVPYADLFKAFEDEPVLYYASDSHWNDKGAALGADVILGALGIRTDYYSAEFLPGEGHRGDLYEMLYPAGRFTEPSLTYAPGFHFTVDGNPNGGNAISITTVNPSGEGSLYCWRDSFGISLYPYLAESFESAFFSRSAAYDLTKAVSSGADCLMIELVERNIPQLISSAPSFPAPSRDMPECLASDRVLRFERDTVSAADKSLTRFFGTLPEDCAEGAEIYVSVGGQCYEACAVYVDEGMGFSLWLPSESDIETVICRTEDGLCAFPAEEI